MVERRAALDTSVLLQVQWGADGDCKRAHQFLRDSKFLFVATPTVIQELERSAADLRREFASALATNILSSPERLDLVLESMTDVEHDVTDIHVRRVLERNILPDRPEAPGFLQKLVEAAYRDCLLFLTQYQAALENRHTLTFSLIQDCGMRSLYIFSPAEIMHFLGSKHR